MLKSKSRATQIFKATEYPLAGPSHLSPDPRKLNSFLPWGLLLVQGYFLSILILLDISFIVAKHFSSGLHLIALLGGQVLGPWFYLLDK